MRLLRRVAAWLGAAASLSCVGPGRGTSPPPAVLVGRAGPLQGCHGRHAGSRSPRDRVGAAQRAAVHAQPRSTAAELTGGAYVRVLNRRGTARCRTRWYLDLRRALGVRAVGVNVATRPSDGRYADCIARAVRDLTFPVSECTDVTRPSF